MLFKDLRIFDPGDLGSSDQVGAHILGSGTTVITHTTDGSKERLDVSIGIESGDQADFGLYAEDSAAPDAGIGQGILVKRQDTLASDVSADGDFGWAKMDSAGALYVAEQNILDVTETFDAAQAGTAGLMVAGIRQDAGGSPVSADGDVHPLVFNDDGELKVAADLTSSVADDAADSGNPVKIGGRAVDGALSAISASNDRYDLLGDMYRRTWVNTSPNIAAQTSTVAAGTTAAEIASTPLAGRRVISVQNLTNRAAYIGEANTVTAANGFRIARGATFEMEWGEDIDIWYIGATGSSSGELRILEVA